MDGNHLLRQVTTEGSLRLLILSSRGDAQQIFHISWTLKAWNIHLSKDRLDCRLELWVDFPPVLWLVLIFQLNGKLFEGKAPSYKIRFCIPPRRDLYIVNLINVQHLISFPLTALPLGREHKSCFHWIFVPREARWAPRKTQKQSLCFPEWGSEPSRGGSAVKRLWPGGRVEEIPF